MQLTNKYIKLGYSLQNILYFIACHKYIRPYNNSFKSNCCTKESDSPVPEKLGSPNYNYEIDTNINT